MTGFGDDRGMTLLEVMIAMVIMLVITVPLVSSFVLGIESTTEGQQEVTSSADAQVIATYFDTDISNAEAVRTTTGATCSITSGTAILTLESQDVGGTVLVTYGLVDAPAADKTEAGLSTTATMYHLQRARCIAGNPSSTTTVARQVVATSIECDGVAPCSTSTPRTVTLRVEATSRFLPDRGSTDRYTIAVTSVRKVTP